MKKIKNNQIEPAEAEMLSEYDLLEKKGCEGYTTRLTNGGTPRESLKMMAASQRTTLLWKMER